MYRGFSIDVASREFTAEELRIGTALHATHKAAVSRVVADFRAPSGALRASQMQANWFPQINADIFISHAHRDAPVAIGMVGWLKENFDLDAFVDSCAWGFGDELLRLLDEEYCGLGKPGSFSYELRNRSTSHVHMMLSTALSTMIDRCEAVFFLNTPGSIRPADTIVGIGEHTPSPWIYSELAMTRLIREKSPNEHPLRRPGVEKRATNEVIGVDLLYETERDHLIHLSELDLAMWYLAAFTEAHDHGLDMLYDLKGIRKAKESRILQK